MFFCDWTVRDTNGTFVFLVGGLLLALGFGLSLYRRATSQESNPCVDGLIIFGVAATIALGPLFAEWVYDRVCSI